MDGKWNNWWLIPVFLAGIAGLWLKRHPRLVLAFLLAVLLFLMTGCATQERLVEVKIMIPVACKEEMPQRPVMPTEGLSLGAEPDVQARHMRAEIDRREAYEIKLRTALENCRAPIEVQ